MTIKNILGYCILLGLAIWFIVIMVKAEGWKYAIKLFLSVGALVGLVMLAGYLITD